MADTTGVSQVISDNALRVEIKNEEGSSTKSATPRIRIFNQDSVSYSNLVFYYQFSAEKEFSFNDYYTPNLDISIDTLGVDSLGNPQYRFCFAFQDGLELAPNSYFPNSAGISFGYNYNDWSAWNHNLDFSYTSSYSFIESDNVVVEIAKNENIGDTTQIDTTIVDPSNSVLNMSSTLLDSVNLMLKIYAFQIAKIDTTNLSDSNNISSWVMLKNMGDSAIDLSNWELYLDNNKLLDIDLGATLDPNDTLRLTGFVDSVEISSSGELWLVKKEDDFKKLSSYVAWGSKAKYSFIPVDQNLWSSQKDYLKFISQSGIWFGDIIKLKGELGNEIEDWYKYCFNNSYVAMNNLPARSNPKYPLSGSNYTKDSNEVMNVSLSWERVPDVSSYLLTVVKDSLNGDTIVNLEVVGTSENVEFDQAGDYLWYVESNSAIGGAYDSTNQHLFMDAVDLNRTYITSTVVYSDPENYQGINILKLSNATKVEFEKMLGAKSFASRKDTRMLDLSYDQNFENIYPSLGNKYFKDRWDQPHYINGIYDNDNIFDQTEHENVWCWAVAPQIVNHYYGGDLTLDEIIIMNEDITTVTDTLTNKVKTTSSKVSNINYNQRLIDIENTAPEDMLYHEGNYTDFALDYVTGNNTWKTTGALDITKMIKSIDDSNLVVVRQYNYGHDTTGVWTIVGGHFMVIDGYRLMGGFIEVHLLNTFNSGESAWSKIADFSTLTNTELDTLLNDYQNYYFYLKNEHLDSNITSQTQYRTFNWVWYVDKSVSTWQPRMRNPLIDQDSDGDGMVDFDEIYRFKTDPDSLDSDNDGVNDKMEVKSYTYYGHNADVDSDSLRAELDEDSDNGGRLDGYEDLNGDGLYANDYIETSPYDKSDDKSFEPFDVITLLMNKEYALWAFDRLYINDNSRVYGTLTEGDYLGKVGVGGDGEYSEAILGVRASVGSLYSAGQIWFRDNSTVNYAYSYVDEITFQNKSTVSLPENASDYNKNRFYKKKNFNSFIEGHSEEYIFSPPSSSASYITKEDTLHIVAGDSFTFEAGKYYYKAILIDKGAIINFKYDADRPIEIYTYDFDFRADTGLNEIGLERLAANMVVIVAGDKTQFLSTSIGVTFIAPNAHVVIGQEDKVFYGSVHANGITLHQFSIFWHVKFGEYIGGELLSWKLSY